MGRRDGKKHSGFPADKSAEYLSGVKTADGNFKAQKSSKYQKGTSYTPFVRNQIDPETEKYFAEITNVIEGKEIDLEERSVICGNALEETRGKEVELANDYVISHTLQILLEGCSLDHLCGFLHSCAKNFSHIATDRSGSHVAETALKSLAVHLQDCEQLSLIEETLRKICEEIIVNPVDIMCNGYGSHVLRSLLCLLNGVPLEQFHSTKSAVVLAERMNFKAPRSEGNKLSYSNQSFPDLLKYLVSEMLNTTREDISNLLMDQYCSLVLQTALKLLVGNEPELLHIIQILLGCNMEMDGNFIGRPRLQEILKRVEEPAYSHLFEVIIEVAPEPIYKELLQRVFKNSLFQMSSHHCGNFVVQALASHAKCSEHIDLIWGELGTKFKDLLEMGHSGVVASLVAATQKLHHCEEECCQALASAVCVENEPPMCIIPRILFLDNYFRSEDKSNWSWPNGTRIHVVGSLILQSIFRFPSELIKAFVSGITSLEEHQLLEASKDPSGSRVIEAFLNSNVSAKHKRKLLIKLQGHFGELSVHPLGSFMIEKCFNASNLPLREKIISEMLPLQAELSRTKQGPYLLRRFDVDGYAKQPDIWKSRQASQQSARQEFYAEFGATGTKSRKDSFLADTHKSQPEKLKEMRKEIETSFASSRTSSIPFLAYQGSKTKTKKSAKKQPSESGGFAAKHSVNDDFLKGKNKKRRTEKGNDGIDSTCAGGSEYDEPSKSGDKNEKKRQRREEKRKDENSKSSKKKKNVEG